MATRSLEIEKSPFSLHTRGRAYLELGELEQAMSDLDASFELAPNIAESNYDIARTFDKQKETPTAKVFYQRYLDLAGPHGEFSAGVTERLKEL